MNDNRTSRRLMNTVYTSSFGQTSSKSAEGDHVLQSHSPPSSQNDSRPPSSYADSDNTSGHDEFHLERYSQTTTSEAQRGRAQATGRSGLPSQRQLQASKEMSRPGLNIITTFTDRAQRSFTDNVSLDKVQARRPQVARRAATSIVSAKAEAANTTPPLRRSQSRGDPSIVIGISVPEDEAESFKNSDTLDSALTLETPATPNLVVTSASQRRPTSSIYSTAHTPYTHQSTMSNIPPVPQMPVHYAMATNPIYIKLDKETNLSSADTRLYEDQDNETIEVQTRRNSTESQEQIIPSAFDTARPKSQGWWNLALSPMMSRGGTLKSKQNRKSSIVVAQILAKSARKRKTATSPTTNDRMEDVKDEISPETPRRAGLATEPSEPWSNWSTWDNGESNKKASRADIEQPLKDQEIRDVHERFVSAPIAKQAIQAHMGASAEYYHACAIEQATGVPYFDCINHSCCAKWPVLSSAKEPPTISSIAVPIEDSSCVLSPDIERTTKPDSCEGDGRQRSDSDSTIIDDDPEEISPQIISPNVRKASTAAVVRARALTTDCSKAGLNGRIPETEEEYFPASNKVALPDEKALLPSYSPPRPAVRKMPNIAAVIPPPLVSPGPVSPEMQRSMTTQGAMPMSEVRNQRNVETRTPGEAATMQPPIVTSNIYNYYSQAPVAQSPTPASGVKAHVTLADINKHQEKQQSNEDRRQRHEREDRIITKLGSLWRGRGCFPSHGCFGRSGGPENRERRRLLLSLTAFFLLVVVACIVVATEFTRHGDGTPVQSQWLNLTGFPPMPTGISTIVRPDLTFIQSGCVQPNTLWSCALAKEDQQAVAPNDPDQPNFRFEIRFRNGTVPANETISLSPLPKQRVANDPFTNDLYTPAPNPPSLADQSFLGNTTDNITAPNFEGQQTPFCITFISPNQSLTASTNTSSSKSMSFRTRGLVSRQSNSNSSLLSSIPPPSISSSGLATPANLLPTSPYPSSQPIRLYNRGLTDEHYGFYMYYDRSIFLQDTSILNISSATDGAESVSADQNGGSPALSAFARCTFSQTRFLVRMYTSSSFSGTLFSMSNTSSHTSDGLVSNSATDFIPPGSFPYPTTITLDRHGGDLNAKAVFCYGMDGQGHIIANEKSLVAEDRGFGGPGLVNPAPPLVSLSGQDGDNGFNPSLGGIDGGVGGCGCSWQNWS